MAGTLDVLSVGEGHISLRFDKDNEPEAIRAQRMVSDMLRRGYALLVQTEDGRFRRVKAFDRECCEYIIADFDPIEAAEKDAKEAFTVADEVVRREEGRTPKVGRPKKRGGRLPMHKTKATAVAPTAGGSMERRWKGSL